MVDELRDRISDFPGKAMRVRCFAHVVNLIVKTILKQFDVPDKKKDEIVSEALGELKGMGTDLEDDETDDLSMHNDGEDDNDDNVDGWMDEREEMSEDELANLESEVQPVRKMLGKVRRRLNAQRPVPTPFVDIVM